MKAIYENHYLTDQDVANYARQSFAKLAKQFTEAQNNQLIRFLARGMMTKDWDALVTQLRGQFSPQFDQKEAHDMAVYLRKIPEHWVPFGHPHITLRMQAPIPIRVQCFKHKIGFVESEESRRYISSRPEFFQPPAWREAAANVKQGSAGIHPDSSNIHNRYFEHCRDSIELYENMIDDGVCPEQARFVLPQGCEVNWVWTGSLYAFANAYNQRSDSHAQKEIQDLFAVVDKIIDPLFPVSWGALTRGEY